MVSFLLLGPIKDTPAARQFSHLPLWPASGSDRIRTLLLVVEQMGSVEVFEPRTNQSSIKPQWYFTDEAFGFGSVRPGPVQSGFQNLVQKKPFSGVLKTPEYLLIDV
ncbi:hypothetical protein ILYODFUR_036755 [Ilyodon furcidens]|uniref:Uncharacterized protein n=1 Tax=Ilyodon furcidens TaxID=33524 RepID=A0ABV0UPF3_9TELE